MEAGGSGECIRIFEGEQTLLYEEGTTMPRGDGTGPAGLGPMTGRAAGYCAGFGIPGYMNPSAGRGFGIGFGKSRGFWGRGWGWRNMYYATGLPGWMRLGVHAVPYVNPSPYYPAYQKPDPETEKQALKEQSEYLESELEAIRKRLEEVEKESEQR